MSFVVVVNANERFVKFAHRETPYYSSFKKTGDAITIYSGELHRVEKYLEEVCWNTNPNLLMINESFSVLKIDKINELIWFANSISGLEPLFYYNENDFFIISDDFWEVLNVIRPEEGDLDEESIFEYLNLPYALFDGTFVKGVKFLLPGRAGCYDMRTGELSINAYHDFRYVEESVSLDEAVECVREQINTLMKDILDECGDVQYSVGLSGGLDSRVIPYFAKENGMKINSFIIGAIRPNTFLLSKDHKNSRKLAKIFQLNHKEVEWSKKTLDKKIMLDLKNYPMGTPQFFKYEYYSDCDVLLNGGNGLVVGSTMPYNLNAMSDEQLVHHIWNLARGFTPNTRLNRRIEMACKFLFSKEINIKHKENWYEKILNEDTKKRIENKLQQFISNEKKNGKSNIDIYEEYFNNMLGARNRFGGFESACGEKRSFSIYAPRLLNDTLKWPIELLEGRPVLKELIRKHISVAASVGEQNYMGSIIKKESVLTKLFNMAVFILRGNGTAMEQKYFKHCHKEFKKVMQNDCRWFYNLVDVRGDLNKIVRFDDIGFVLTLWKSKMVVDLIELGDFPISDTDERIMF